MPVQYSGIIEEHLHTRNSAGLFDICHMGEFIVSGAEAEKDLDFLLTSRIDNLSEGRCRYGFLLNSDGGIIDDLIVFKMEEQKFMLVVNAGTVTKDMNWIKDNLSPETVFEDITERTAKLDLQGPKSPEILVEITGKQELSGLGRFNFIKIDMGGVDLLVSRTGYTGEIGYELFLPVDKAGVLWDKLISHEYVKPVGLGARDTLRMEMGYSLYGNDIDEEHTPVESGLTRFVYMEKDFSGKQALLSAGEKDSDFILKGFICEGRRSARSHFNVIVAGEQVGEVTSGAFSPCLKKGIGFCYIRNKFAAQGSEIVLTDGKAEIKAVIKDFPLYDHKIGVYPQK